MEWIEERVGGAGSETPEIFRIADILKSLMRPIRPEKEDLDGCGTVTSLEKDIEFVNRVFWKIRSYRLW